MTVIRSTVRWNRTLEEFELRCETCAAKGNVAAYWPLTREFWDVHSMRRCRACNLELDRWRAKEARQDPEKREKEHKYVRVWRERNPDYAREYAAAYRRLTPREVRRERQREYYYRHRDVILAQQREYKRRRKAA